MQECAYDRLFYESMLSFAYFSQIRCLLLFLVCPMFIYQQKSVNNFNFVDIMNKLKDCGLKVKDDINFPLNVVYFKKDKNVLFTKKPNIIPKEMLNIENEELKFYENLLFPQKSSF